METIFYSRLCAHVSLIRSSDDWILCRFFWNPKLFFILLLTFSILVRRIFYSKLTKAVWKKKNKKRDWRVNEFILYIIHQSRIGLIQQEIRYGIYRKIKWSRWGMTNFGLYAFLLSLLWNFYEYFFCVRVLEDVLIYFLQ